MKKFNLILLGLILSAAVASAQNISLGLRGGLTLTKFQYEDKGVDTKNLLGFNGGAFMTYSANRAIAFTLEMNYAGKGAKFDGGPVKDPSTRLSYFEVPAYLNFFLGGEKLRPKLFAGGYYGSLLTAKTKRYTVSGSEKLVDIKDATNKSDFGALFGAGLHYRITGENWLIFDVRYNLGLANVSKVKDVSQKNRGFSFNVGFSFPLSGV